METAMTEVFTQQEYDAEYEEVVSSWWFAASDRLPYKDGRKIIIGKTHSLKGQIILCNHALHGSIHPFDALQYATGPYLYKVEQWGDIIQENDKLGSRYRKYLQMHDITYELRLFARQQALSVIHLWDAPEIVKKYLETGEELIRDAARSVAEDSAWNAARSAARSAAKDSAWNAARFAARSAAKDSAWNAALSAAWAVEAWNAARSAARSAASPAAWAAAWAAAWNAVRAVEWDAAWNAARAVERDAAEDSFLKLIEDKFNVHN
jgi:hypothetical protein